MARPAAQRASVAIDGRTYAFDAARAHSLAIALDFDGRQPHWFGNAVARSTALQAGSFTGRVGTGASCNCSTISLTPHCDGTHTECAGHLTREPLYARAVVPTGFIPALLLSITPLRGDATPEGSHPAPRATDLLVTRHALEAAWPAALPFAPRALVVRTLPNGVAKRTRDYTRQGAPYLSMPAAAWMVERGIEHLVLDVPSADRADDEGRLSAHRVFFGLPPGATALADVQRPGSTITELAYVDDALADGPWLLALQLPELGGDAVPSRPLLYALQAP